MLTDAYTRRVNYYRPAISPRRAQTAHKAPCRYELATQGAFLIDEHTHVIFQTFVMHSWLIYYIAVHRIDETTHVIFQTTVMFQLLID